MPKQVHLNLENKIPDAVNGTIVVLDSVVRKIFADEFVTHGTRLEAEIRPQFKICLKRF